MVETSHAVEPLKSCGQQQRSEEGEVLLAGCLAPHGSLGPRCLLLLPAAGVRNSVPLAPCDEQVRRKSFDGAESIEVLYIQDAIFEKRVYSFSGDVLTSVNFQK